MNEESLNVYDQFLSNFKMGHLVEIGKLVSGQPAAEGEIRILGSTDGQSPGTVAIAKLTKRVATDFSGNRYTWYLDNDSSADVLMLTAI